MFNQRSQQSGESAEAYYEVYTRWENNYCDFGTAKDDHCIRDRLVIEVRDKSLLKRLQLKEELTLAKSVMVVRQSEVIQDQLSIQNETVKSIEEVNKQRYSKHNRESQTGKKSGNN